MNMFHNNIVLNLYSYIKYQKHHLASGKRVSTCFVLISGPVHRFKKLCEKLQLILLSNTRRSTSNCRAEDNSKEEQSASDEKCSSSQSSKLLLAQLSDTESEGELLDSPRTSSKPVANNVNGKTAEKLMWKVIYGASGDVHEKLKVRVKNQIPSEVKECEENKNKLNGNVVELRSVWHQWCTLSTEATTWNLNIQTVDLDADYLLIAGNPRQSNLKWIYIFVKMFRFLKFYEIYLWNKKDWTLVSRRWWSRW